MHKAYLGQKQFSIEGLDMTVPMLDELIQLAAAHGAREVVVGMAHRGRLNVLAHNLGRPYETIFAEFEGASTLEAVTTIPQGGTGDVKYHHGAQGSYQLPDGDSILVNLESQPVAPRVRPPRRRRRHARRADHAPGPARPPRHRRAVPIVLHGDAAFPGQGVVAETLNLQALDGYKVGGTLHLITEQPGRLHDRPRGRALDALGLGPRQGLRRRRSSTSTPTTSPACISAVRLAFAFRQEFGHDVVIDLIGYRRFGHNEADEPAYTQPEMYAKIKAKKRVSRAVGRAAWSTDGVVTQEEVEQPAPGGLGRPHAAAPATSRRRSRPPRTPARSSSRPASTSSTARRRPRSRPRSPPTRLRALNEELLRVPEGFTVHPKLVKQLERRRDGARRRRRHRLGARRGAGVRVAADRGHADPPHRPGRRARHVLPAPHGPARRQDRPDASARSRTCPARWRRSSCTTRR